MKYNKTREMVKHNVNIEIIIKRNLIKVCENNF